MGTSADDDAPAADSLGASAAEWAHAGSSEIRMLKFAQEHHAEVLLDAAAVGLALFDDDDRLVCSNRAYGALLGGLEKEDVMGRTALELLEAWEPLLVFEGDDQREHLTHLHAVELDERGLSFEVTTKDGRRLRVTDRRSGAKGRARTIWPVSDPITPTATPESAPESRTDTRTGRLELLSRLNRKLLAPLNAMLGFAQLMQGDRLEALSERHQRRLERVLQNGEDLARLIEEVVDVMRLEAGTTPIRLEAVDPVAVLNDVSHALQHAAANTGSSLWVETTPSEGPRVLVDPRRFARILMCLGSNAVKFNRPNGAVRFAVSSPEADRARISVHDNGNGIPVERQPKLLGSPEPEEPGAEITGTGLTVAKRLAELMGGTLGFKSTPGAGSEFWVDVRLA